ncbi:uncharacterized protein BJ212DRAFT_1296000 [Suillus subaureus]|uniref:Uncharacterized protein n=1 Tax=Suillus subaureus TaxID=48587 RepID=A0A9P7EJJ9_9AGAM|nr:uncharacterized protein BJ212DRAFT_1296000 [Suillus subaureus]KAG1823354.1 hypothetical protein BJ212DRAFT_1296000 [Suillus subaureus]
MSTVQSTVRDLFAVPPQGAPHPTSPGYYSNDSEVCIVKGYLYQVDAKDGRILLAIFMTCRWDLKHYQTDMLASASIFRYKISLTNKQAGFFSFNGSAPGTDLNQACYDHRKKRGSSRTAVAKLLQSGGTKCSFLTCDEDALRDGWYTTGSHRVVLPDVPWHPQNLKKMIAVYALLQVGFKLDLMCSRNSNYLVVATGI